MDSNEQHISISLRIRSRALDPFLLLLLMVMQIIKQMVCYISFFSLHINTFSTANWEFFLSVINFRGLHKVELEEGLYM